MTVAGIGGGTGAGKTSLARRIAEHFDPGEVATIYQDSYYLNRSHIPLSTRRKTDFDHPDAFDTELLVSHIERLKRGETIHQPIYSYTTHTRSAQTRRLDPCAVLLVEGILVLHAPRLRQLMDMKIYVDAPDDVRFIRRLQRDIRERSRTVDEVIEQYYDTVRPGHLKFVEPTRRYADMVIPGEGDQTAAVASVVARIRSASGYERETNSGIRNT